ncbi:MAG TPA: hypothetical protein VNS58_17585 [Puia sp.]|nr:hypothetical protein [Puia sp.]
MRIFLFIFSAVLFIILQLIGGLSSWENLSVCVSVFALLIFLLNLGNKVALFDITIMMACVTCLIMPVIFYHFYTKGNPLARIWVKYMPIASDDYFSYALPGVIALMVGFKIPLGKSKNEEDPGVYLEKVKAYLGHNPKLGWYLVTIGVVAGLLDFLAPAGLSEFFFLAAHLVFVGVFYVMYSPSKNKKLVVASAILLMLGDSILTGMFGELVFILACSMVLVLLGKKIKYRKKLSLVILGIFLVILIQSVKGEYRRRSWFGGGADPLYFAQLIGERISSPSTMLDPQGMFVLSVRMNQGWLVANTMRLVPSRYSFGNGEPLVEAVFATVVPRFLWPDKPEAGGKANLKRFWGFNLIGWSTNIGTLGEAYANFDRVGGIVYMFCYGLFFSFILTMILKLSKRRPTIILWLPFLFFSAISVETDLLTTMGALIKSVIFAWIIFRVFDSGFRIKL